jgi:hypothetical protein
MVHVLAAAVCLFAFGSGNRLNADDTPVVPGESASKN